MTVGTSTVCLYGGTSVSDGTTTRHVCNGAPGTPAPPEYRCPTGTTPIIFSDFPMTICVREIGSTLTKMSYLQASTECAAAYGSELCGHQEFIQLCDKGYPFRGSAWLGGFNGTTAMGTARDAPCSVLPVTVDARTQESNWGYCCRSLPGIATL